MRGAPQEDDTDPAFAARREALAHYRRGEADLQAAADQAGLQEWEFLEEAQAMPDPVAPARGLGPNLPTFIRDRK